MSFRLQRVLERQRLSDSNPLLRLSLAHQGYGLGYGLGLRVLGMVHLVLMPDGVTLASREAWMMMHPSLDPDCMFESGDLVQLEEGIFVLNDDLNPMVLATDAQVQQATGRPAQ